MTLAERMALVLETQKAYQEALHGLMEALKSEQVSPALPEVSPERLTVRILAAMEPGKSYPLEEIGKLVGVAVAGRLRTAVSRLKLAKKLVRTGEGTYRRAG